MELYSTDLSPNQHPTTAGLLKLTASDLLDKKFAELKNRHSVRPGSVQKMQCFRFK